jgi:hypothetical protein
VLHVRSVPHVRCFRHVTALSQALDENHEHVAAFLRSAGAIDGLGGHDDPDSYSSCESRMKPRKLHDGHPDCPLCKESASFAAGQAGHGDSTAGSHCS